MPLSTNLPTNL